MEYVENVEQFARDHPMLLMGVLLFPAVYGVTGKLWMAAFTSGVVAFGKEIGEGLSEATDGDEQKTTTFADLMEDDAK